jgi:hypothetical protein
MANRDFPAARLNAQALRLRRLGLSYKEVARMMGNLSPERGRWIDVRPNWKESPGMPDNWEGPSAWKK